LQHILCVALGGKSSSVPRIDILFDQLSVLRSFLKLIFTWVIIK
jgi:hypothetical protein